MFQSLVPFAARVSRRLVECERELAVLDRRVSYNDDDLARPVDLDARNMHTGSGHSLNRPCHVLLPECARGAAHDYCSDCSELCLCEVIEGIARRAESGDAVGWHGAAQARW